MEPSGATTFLINDAPDWLLDFTYWLSAPVPPNGAKGDGGVTNSGDARDPNAMLGPAGYGSPNFVALSGAAFPYQIDFENDPTATAPAQDVTITDQLDITHLDISTFQLSGIGWGDTVLSIPAGSQHYEATVPMTYNGQTFDVDVEAGIHTATGQVYATFTSIDPNTELPPDVSSGFLPPEDGTGRGEGYVSYTIQPKAGLATGTAITNVALVTFDQNIAIATDQANDEDPSQGVSPAKQALVTIDAGAPTSSIGALPPVESTASFTVTWSGQDDPGGSGVATYDVYVSDNGGPYVSFLTGTAATSATFTGQPDHTYGFYSVATDNVGNVQATPTHAQATTRIPAAPNYVLTTSNASPVYGQSQTFEATLNPGAPGLPTPTGTVQFLVDGNTLGSPVNLVNGVADSTSLSTLAAGQHTITASYSGDSTYFAGSTGVAETVGKATLIVTANGQTKVYGAPVPAFTYAISGFVNGDTIGVVSGAPSLTTSATSASGAGSYTITVGVGTLAATNYNFPTLVAGTLSVTPAPLTIKANDQIRGMGQSNPPLTASYSGFVNGDGPSSLTSPAVLATSASSTSPAGVYPITVGGAASPNYAITFVNGMLTVTQPLVTMTNVQSVANKKRLVTQIILSFSGALDAAEAREIGFYRLATAGKNGSFTAKNAKVIKLKSAVYSGSSNTVALTPTKPFALTKPVQLLVYATGAFGSPRCRRPSDRRQP